MRILADTNVMIDYMKRPSEKMIEVFQNEDIVISGVVVSELFHGALSEKELKSLEEDLSVYECLNIREKDWNEFGRFLYSLVCIYNSELAVEKMIVEKSNYTELKRFKENANDKIKQEVSIGYYVNCSYICNCHRLRKGKH